MKAHVTIFIVAAALLSILCASLAAASDLTEQLFMSKQLRAKEFGTESYAADNVGRRNSGEVFRIRQAQRQQKKQQLNGNSNWEMFEFLQSASSVPSSSSVPASEQQQQQQEQQLHSDDLVSVLFLHRHGARTSAVVRNNVPDWNGCILSVQGEQMARSLGKYIRGRYKSSWQYFPPSYDPVQITSVTTDFERTIKTGTAVLQGMFDEDVVGTTNNTPPVAPYLQHLPADMDFMLGWYYSWPAAQLHAHEILGWYTTNNEYASHLFNESEFEALGAFLGAPKLCKEKPATCVIVSEDFLTCELSNRPETDTKKEVRDFLPRLLEAYARNVHYIYFSRPESSFFRGIGYYAAEVVRDIIRNARMSVENAKQGRLGKPGVPSMFQYSAHDITVYGLLVALGVIDDQTTDFDLRTPTFAATVLFEVYGNSTMRLIYATCNQSFNSSHEYREHHGPQFLMSCRSEAGIDYKAESCLIDDVERKMNHTIRVNYTQVDDAISDTMCYADPIDINSTNCSLIVNSSASINASVSTSADSSSSNDQELFNNNTNCQYWRRYCPQVACSWNWVMGEKLVLDGSVSNSNNDVSAVDPRPASVPRHVWNETSQSSTLGPGGSELIQCVPVQPVRIRERDVLRTAGSKAGVFIASLLLGVVFGAALAAFCARRRDSNDSAAMADETKNLLKYAESTPKKQREQQQPADDVAVP